MAEDEGTFDTVSARLLATVANILAWAGHGAQPKKKCFCDKGQTSSWQMPVGQAGRCRLVGWMTRWGCCLGRAPASPTVMLRISNLSLAIMYILACQPGVARAFALRAELRRFAP